MMNIENAIALAKCVINYIVIAITNCYQTVVSKALYLITTNIRDIFGVS